MFRFDEEFMQIYDKGFYKGYLPEVDADYPRELKKEQSDLPFLPKKMKFYKCEKHFCNLYDKKNYVINIRAPKHALDHGRILKFITKNPYSHGAQSRSMI